MKDDATGRPQRPTNSAVPEPILDLAAENWNAIPRVPVTEAGRFGAWGSHVSAPIFRPPRNCGEDMARFACAPEPGYRQPAWRSQARRALGFDFSHWVMDRASLESIFSFMQTQYARTTFALAPSSRLS